MLTHRFPHALAADAILLEDDAWIVVNKPVDVSVEGGGAGDDLVGRLRRVLAARDGVPADAVYLRAHQHLERDTSGVVALARCPQANGPLATAAQQRLGRLRVLVAGTAGAHLLQRGDFDGHVRRERDGTVRTANKHGPGTERVQGSYRVLERQGTRVVVEVTARQTHVRNLRAVLVAGGIVTPAGDVALGGEPSPRLLVHVLGAQLNHPLRGAPVEVTTPEPWQFSAWVRDALGIVQVPADALFAAIDEAVLRRDALLRREALQAVRLLHGEAEGLRGLDIEAYGSHLVVWLGEQVADNVREGVLDWAERMGPRGVYLKVRPKQASRIVDAQARHLSSAHAARGEDAPESFEVREGDLRFVVHLGEGLSTGLFLDQRKTRAWVREHAADQRVLNLFAYTCSFTVAAAAGGARSTVSVDASARVLEQGRVNLERNGLLDARHELVCADVLSWLRDAAAAGRTFDMVILDPPSYSTTRESRFSAERDYVALAAACLDRIAVGGGTLVACTNHRGVDGRRLRGWLHEAASQASREFEGLESIEGEADFPAMLGGTPHLKVVRCRVAARGAPGAGGLRGRSEATSRTMVRARRPARRR